MKEYNSFLNFFFVKDKILQERRDRIFIGFILLFKYSISNLFSSTTSKQQYYKIFLHQDLYLKTPYLYYFLFRHSAISKDKK